MATTGKSAAISHVGKVRANNQDSGYAGTHLFVVADGMGGHAGGDVASAIAIKRIVETDREYTSAEDAEYALKSALLAANAQLAETVFEHTELTGMGTTVSAILRVGSKIALAHIGDSRIYLLRDDELSQVTADHTFVQRLVDSGRITQEEAAVHPRRSVLMRVLGDVDSSPEIDTTVLEVRPGDKWLLCSDGLSSYVSDERIAAILREWKAPRDAADRLVRESLDAGAPDNVTVVIATVDDGDSSASSPTVLVGSAAAPLSFEPEVSRRPLRLPTLLLHPLRPTPPEPEHFEPESEEYLDELILEDRRRARNRRIAWLVAIALAAIALAVALVLAYQWTQTRYFVGATGQTVAIYQGVQADIGPLSLSTVYEETSITLESLPSYTRQTVEGTISADSLAQARAIIDRLSIVSSD
ncbi:Stp1/IreP family PP2C-type Ser/Thr phosphatase [Marisediminicola senii]|uniref:Stp1/IreP family PP2C-type Ser/Thr phosphatase n=1 Tax=Marisediminicola senii TaxID=2711233 RepID=UPI0013EC3E07|nr:Stp1/IreP family PP2C-type Ser/Thr phosphatase [Marisediminicola senii]